MRDMDMESLGKIPCLAGRRVVDSARQGTGYVALHLEVVAQTELHTPRTGKCRAIVAKRSARRASAKVPRVESDCIRHVEGFPREANDTLFGNLERFGK